MFSIYESWTEHSPKDYISQFLNCDFYMSIFFNYFLVGGHAALNKTVLGISWPRDEGMQ